MLNLQRKIAGEDVTLSSNDMKTILRQPHDNIFYRVYYRALMSKNVNATDILLNALTHIETTEELLLVALPLRYGANANLYVEVPSRGTMHIIPYVFSLPWESGKKTLRLRDNIVRLLLLSNSLASKLCFDKTGGASSVDNSDKSLNASSSSTSPEKTTETKGETVHEYCLRVYGKDLSVPVIPEKFEAIYLDNADLLRTSLDERDRREVVRCFASKLWPLLPKTTPLQRSASSSVATNSGTTNPGTTKTRDIMKEDAERSIEDPPGMLFAFEFYNTEVYRELVEEGYLPSYLLLTNIIMTLHQATEQPMLEEELSAMLFQSIKYGATVDKMQYGFVGSKKKKAFDDIYNVPYYKKACSTSTDLPPPTELRRQFYMIEGTPHASKDVMCRTFSELAKTSREKAEEIIVANTMQKLAKPTILSSLNPSTEILHKEEYTRLPDQLVTHIDANDNLNLYTADRYRDLLAQGRDNYTEKPLPSHLLREIREKEDTLQRRSRELYIDPLEIRKIRVPSSLRSVFEPDTPRDDDVRMQYFLRILIENNVRIKYWESLSEKNIMSLLRRVGVRVSEATSNMGIELQQNRVAVLYLTYLSPDERGVLLGILQSESVDAVQQ